MLEIVPRCRDGGSGLIKFKTIFRKPREAMHQSGLAQQTQPGNSILLHLFLTTFSTAIAKPFAIKIWRVTAPFQPYHSLKHRISFSSLASFLLTVDTVFVNSHLWRCIELRTLPIKTRIIGHATLPN
jgi:hypothetical protein